jgi:hypothetical protein
MRGQRMLNELISRLTVSRGASPSPAKLKEKDRGSLSILIALAIRAHTKLLTARLPSFQAAVALWCLAGSASKANNHLIF